MRQIPAEILRSLREGPMAPSDLAASLDVSATEIHLRIEELRASGYDIPLHPILGYTLGDDPERLVHADIVSRLKMPWLSRIEVLGSVGSTNTLAIEHGMKGERGPSVFLAEHQTAGRGRFGRVWDSKNGEGLWMSILLRPKLAPSQWARLTTIAALAVVETIESTTRLPAQIKWPNDVVISGLKISGILAESTHGSDGEAFVALGIGLNVNQTEFPETLATSASSLRILSGIIWNRSMLAATLLDKLGALVEAANKEFGSILTAVKKRSSVLGKELTVHTGGNPIAGVAEDLDDEGRLLIRLPDGQLQGVGAGEVSLREIQQGNIHDCAKPTQSGLR